MNREQHVPAEAEAGLPAAIAPVPYRLRIGVTGHRALEHPDAVAARVREVLASRIDELFDAPPPRGARTTPWAFTVVTSLAEGADRIVAREVLRTPESGIDAVLPFSAERYREDFATDESRHEFDELYARSSAEKQITCAGSSRPGVAVRTDDRGAAYLRAGHAVVDGCDVLIAIWDGQPARGAGGTANIVAHARLRRRPLVIVPHDGSAGVAIEPGTVLGAAALLRMESFNTFASPEPAREVEEARAFEDLFGPGKRGNVAQESKEFVRTRLIPYYVRASLIAQRNKRGHTGAGMLAYVLSPLAVAAVAVGAIAHPAALVGGALELVLLATILAVLFHADRNKVHKKWIEARYVAERVRSATFCVACGVPPSRTGVPPWLVHTGGADAWAFRAADEVARRAAAPPSVTPGQLPGALEFVRDVWLEEQLRYHERRSTEVGFVSRALESAGRWMFVAALAVAALHLALIAYPAAESLRWFERSVTFFALILPACGAAIGGIRTHRELSRLERRHQAMAGIVRQLQERCASVEAVDELAALVRETEGVMFDESGEWLALMRFARIDAT